jgi:hypothetical protein
MAASGASHIIPSASGADGADEPDVAVGGAGGADEPDVAVGGAGGADVAEGGAGAHQAGAGGARRDITPPQIIATSPRHGERGVRSDSTITIRFSEPMHREQTASAVELVGAPASFEWNDLGTELTLVPTQLLEYGHGSDPPLVEAIAYSVSVSTLATDVAGNALDEEFRATFYTSRELSLWPLVRGSDALTGYAVDSVDPRASAAYVDPSVGDALDLMQKGFITFSLGRLPAETQAVTRATLTAGQYTITGDPYEMGSMMVEQVSFSAPEFVLSAPVKQSLGALFAAAEPETASLDVTSVVQAELAQRGQEAGRVQFRFGFEQAVHANGISDDVRLRPVTLDISYLVP